MRSKRALILAPLGALAVIWMALHAVSRFMFTEAHAGSGVTTLDPPIVDYVAVFTGMREAHEERALLERLGYGETVAAQLRDTQIKTLEAAVEQLPDGSPERAAAQKRLDTAVTRDKELAHAASAKNERREKNDMVRLFGKIEAGVAKVAAAHGLSAPVATTPAVPTDLESISVNDLRNLLLKRVVRLPNAPDNLTPEVLSYVDSQYETEKRTASTDGGPDLLTTSTAAGEAP